MDRSLQIVGPVLCFFPILSSPGFLTAILLACNLSLLGTFGR